MANMANEEDYETVFNVFEEYGHKAAVYEDRIEVTLGMFVYKIDHPGFKKCAIGMNPATIMLDYSVNPERSINDIAFIVVSVDNIKYVYQDAYRRPHNENGPAVIAKYITGFHYMDWLIHGTHIARTGDSGSGRYVSDPIRRSICWTKKLPKISKDGVNWDGFVNTGLIDMDHSVPIGTGCIYFSIYATPEDIAKSKVDDVIVLDILRKQ